jgi:hypothetical protein
VTTDRQNRNRRQEQLIAAELRRRAEANEELPSSVTGKREFDVLAEAPKPDAPPVVKPEQGA